MSLISFLRRFLFQRVSATGFGAMRVAWGFVVLVHMLLTIPELLRYYSSVGVLPNSLGHIVFRSHSRFTLLEYFDDPSAVFVLFTLLIIAAFCMMIGWKTRWSTIAAVVLFFSFQERNLLILTGGDTVLRCLGLLLMISPKIDAFSIDRLKRQAFCFRTTGGLLPKPKQAVWPYRLLLWQVIIIYASAGIEKLPGTMWWHGTAVGSVLHHPHFFRWPTIFADTLSVLSPFLSWLTLLFLCGWILLLVPKFLVQNLPSSINFPLKRILIVSGILFHGSIILLFDVGPFSFTLFVAYLGLLLEEDLDVLHSAYKKKHRGTLIVFNDGTCSLCQKTRFLTTLLDWSRSIRCIDLHDKKAKEQYGKDLSLKELMKEIHVRDANGNTYRGFSAIATIAKRLPIFLPVAWALPLPFVRDIGNRVYTWVAENRGCRNGICKR